MKKHSSRKKLQGFIPAIIVAIVLSAPFCTIAHTSEARGADNRMPARELGSTGFRTAIFGLGGQSVIETPGREEEAEEIINTALDLGVNYIDTAPRYGNGVSETNIGRVMQHRRGEVFLATKSHHFCYEGTMELIGESLERLQTGYIDLYQHHGVHTEEQFRRITAEDGALRAFLELREKGIIVNIGIASHSPLILLKALELGVYDCMLLTLNPAGEVMEDRERLEEFMLRAQAENVGVVAMKILNRGALLRDGVGMEDIFRYALSYPVATAVIGISEPWQIYDNFETARNFRRLSSEEKSGLERRFGAEIPRERGSEPEILKPSGGCFIAEAAYGCPRSEGVLALTGLRDDYLSRSRAGNILISAYCILSPPLAAIIASNSVLKKIMRLHMAPVAKTARHPGAKHRQR